MKEYQRYRTPNQYSVGDLVRVDGVIEPFPIETGMIIEVYTHIDQINMNDVWEDRWIHDNLDDARRYAYYDVMYNKNSVVEHAISEIWLSSVPPAALHVSDNIALQ